MDVERDELDRSFAAQAGLLAMASPLLGSFAFMWKSFGTQRDAVVNFVTSSKAGLTEESRGPALAANEFNLVEPNPVPVEHLIISEFRFRGPAGVADEYIEFANTTGQSITVSTSDGSAGWALVSINSSGVTSTRFVIPNGTVIGLGRHYLVANSAYSLSANAAADQTYSADIGDNTGIALFNTSNAGNFNANNRIDAVGFSAVSNSLFREGAGLTAVTAGSSEYAHVRKLITGPPQDTDDNAADFITISTNAATLGGVASTLGAPGPENRLSPLDLTSQVSYTLADPGVSASAAPNRVRSLTPVPNGAAGTLAFRYKVTNNTGQAITRFRGRVIDLTTVNSPLVVTPPQAVVTLLDSSDQPVTLSTGTVTVRGARVEQPPTQAMAGGMNSTQALDHITLSTPLQPGESFYYEIKFGVQTTGNFRWNINAEVALASDLDVDPSGDNFSAARLDAANRTGSPGEDLASRNLNWSLPLVSLPGRAGLDLGLSLSYNSLVWTKSGSAIRFDADRGFPGPGFRLGFPVIEPRYLDSSLGTNAYLMVTSSGSRVQLRQVGTSNIYESGDSSYLQLTENGSDLLLRSTDGSRLTYALKNGGYRCIEVKDRNGNYITASYRTDGKPLAVLDTLGRTIDFNYDSYQNLSSITQSWKGGTVTHVWATFGYTDLQLQYNFSGLTVVGPASGSVIPSLTQVGLADGSKYEFTYNTWGQVYRFSHSPIPSYEARYTSYNLPLNAGTALDDCPRYTERTDWAGNWGSATTTFTPHNFASGSTTATLPDTTQYKEFFVGTTGWQRGLTTQTEIWFEGVRKKWSTLSWTQDNEGLAYPKNPRVTESNINDQDGNVKRTTIDYGTYAAYGLPYLVTEYGAGGSGILRKTQTDYNLASAYLNSRIIGLVSVRQVGDGSVWQSKTVYGYDAGASGNTSAIQHDSSSYGSGFTTGRGNLTSAARYDVTDIDNASKALTTSINYDVNGSVLSTSDPKGHQSSISYTDSFADDIPRNTFAYPTTVTDAGSASSLLRYNYDFGARTRTQDPLGQVQLLEYYDDAARIRRVTTESNGAYTRYVYGPDFVQTFSTVNTVADEAYSIQVFDGTGRVFAVSRNHPGSVGGYSTQISYFDAMGRMWAQSNPIETTSGWVPTGDDTGYLYTYQSYDWNGRPRITTNTDGTTKEASYSGCGCAGGAVVTFTDEGTLDGGTAKRRQQKIYADPLGRTIKTEVLNWQGGSVYSSVTNSYNARDQVTDVYQYAGPEGSGTAQVTTMTYDGYGRLKTKHVPEQNSGTATTWVYNSDDTVQKVTDARGSVSNFTYNSRHLVTGITYDPSLGVAYTPDVSFDYDAAGNRTSMTDGSGSVTYHYDQLSRMDWEERSFNGLSGSYRVGYGYNLAGQLTSLAEPTQFGSTFSYVYDTAGRVTQVNGSGSGGVISYASNSKYRAWGALKHLNYGNAKTLDATYTARLQPDTFTIPGVMAKSYDYYDDGALRFSGEANEHKFDRFLSYDHAARIKEAFSGAEARFETLTNARPYRQTFGYDALGHLTSRTSNVWANDFTPPADAYSNNRRDSSTYDAAGNVLASSDNSYTYDAAGQIKTVSTLYEPASSTSRGLDGQGQQVKTVETTFNEQTQTDDVTTKYYLRSTVLGGQVLSEISELGTKVRTFVYGGGSVLAWQMGQSFGHRVVWEHRDASGASFRTTDASGNPGGLYPEEASAELDPTGANAGSHAPLIEPGPSPDENGGGSLIEYPRFSSPSRPGMTYAVDGIPVSVDYFMMQRDNITHGSALFPAFTFSHYSVDTNDGLLTFRTWRAAARTANKTEGQTVIQNWIVTDYSFYASSTFLPPPSSPQEPAKPSHEAGSKQNPYPGCITANWFVNTPQAKAAFDDLWRRTQRSQKENGGWYFYERKTNTLIGRGASEGEKSSMPNESSEFDTQMTQFRQNGRSVILMFDLHTHPLGSGVSGGDMGNINNLNKRMASIAAPGGGHAPIGIVIHGPGKITLYDSNGPLNKFSTRLNECL